MRRALFLGLVAVLGTSLGAARTDAPEPEAITPIAPIASLNKIARVSDPLGAAAAPSQYSHRAASLVENRRTSVDAWDPAMGRNLPDDRPGYQIQVVYVTTPGQTGYDYLANGDIHTWVNRLQDWLTAKFQDRLIFDTHRGVLDVPRLHVDFDLDVAHSVGGNEGGGAKTVNESVVELYRSLNPDSYHAKTLVFVVNQASAATLGYCGYAYIPGDAAFVFPALERCGDDARHRERNDGLPYPAKSILHELFHSYGVGHTCVDDTDLMIGAPECPEQRDWSKPVTVDASRSRYFGGSLSGVDVATLKIWESGRGVRHPALRLGTCWRGEPCIVEEILFTKNHTVHLQVRRGKNWRTVAKLKGTYDPSLKGAYKWEYSLSTVFDTPGEKTFRIYIPATAKYQTYVGRPKTVNVVG